MITPYIDHFENDNTFVENTTGSGTSAVQNVVSSVETSIGAGSNTTTKELILGIHVSKSMKVINIKKKFTDISESIKATIDYLKLNAAQIFVAGPKGYIPSKIDYKKVSAVSRDIDLSVHSAYPTIQIWHVYNNNKTTTKSKEILNNFRAQMVMAQKAGAKNFVVHIAKQYAEDIADTMKILKPIAKKTGVRIVLEMVASKSHPLKTYETPEKINDLITKIGANESWWGICVDTAHVWAAGCDDVKYYTNMKNWLDRIVFKKKIVMFHLNGIYTACGSGKDRHAIAFSSGDKIWSDVDPINSGVRAVVEFCVDRQIPVICEINIENDKDTVDSIAAIKGLVKSAK
jgi:endonuclease IV